MLYRQIGDWERGAVAFKRLHNLHPEDQRAFSRLSEALVNLGQYDALKALLLPMVQRPTPPLWAVLDYATAEQQFGNPLSAIRMLAVGEHEYPTNKAIHYRLMRLFMQQGNTAAAENERVSFRGEERQ